MFMKTLASQPQSISVGRLEYTVVPGNAICFTDRRFRDHALAYCASLVYNHYVDSKPASRLKLSLPTQWSTAVAYQAHPRLKLDAQASACRILEYATSGR